MCISEKPADPKRILHISTKPARNFGTDTTILHGDGSTTVIKNAPNGSGIPTFRGLGNYHGDDSSELAAAMVKKEI